MTYLVSGGAGYIGSHMVKFLQDNGMEAVVLDNFSTGNRWAVNDCEVIEVDLLDNLKLKRFLNDRKFEGVFHFAAKSLVGESVQNPRKYYRNNIIGTLNLVHEMIQNNNNNLVFSSTAAIFGNPTSSMISEMCSKQPINPYGESKMVTEKILEDISKAEDFNVTCLRYFNAAGAHSTGLIGEFHVPETHLIPCILDTFLNRKVFKVFGNKYNTNDGTCVRDYVHVSDLASAHLKAHNNMRKNQGFQTFNLGNGSGFSVLEVLAACERVIGENISYEIVMGREGDPDTLVADSSLAKTLLNWYPKFTSMDEIVGSAWNWHNHKKRFIE